MQSNTAFARITTLKQELEAIDGKSWSAINLWIKRAIPIIATDWPQLIEDFRSIAKPPNWVSWPRVGGSRTGETKNLEEFNNHMNISEIETNNLLNQRKREELLSFLDGIKQSAISRNDELRTLRTSIVSLYQNISHRGSTLPFEKTQQRCYQLFDLVKELVSDPRFDVLVHRPSYKAYSDQSHRLNSSDIGEFSLGLESLLGYIDTLLPNNPIHDQKEQLMSSTQTEQELLQVLRVIDDEEQKNPNHSVPTSIVASQTGLPISQIRDYFELLKQDGRIDLQGTRGESYAQLTAIGRVLLRDPQFRPSTGPQAVINMPNPTFNNSLVNINSTIIDTIQTLSSSSSVNSNDRDQLIHLVEQLSSVLKSAPVEVGEDAESVADAAKSLAEAVTKDKPNKKTITITSDGLKAAAQNLAGTLPTVIPIVGQIIQHIGKMFP